MSLLEKYTKEDVYGLLRNTSQVLTTEGILVLFAELARIILADGTVLKKSKSRLFVQSNKTAASFDLLDPNFNIDGLDIMVEKGCEEMPKRPIILLTGFDFNNDLPHSKWFFDYFQNGQLKSWNKCY